MPKNEIQNLLVVGLDTVSIAGSARKAGYKVYAAEYFGDMDLRRVCSQFKAIIKQKRGKSCGRMKSKFKPEAFLKMAKSLSEKYRVDAILLSSGLDDEFDILYKLDYLAPILGNTPEVVKKVRKKPEFFNELKSLGINHPKTFVAENISEARDAASKIGYPVILKPFKGFGGANTRIVRDSTELEKAFYDIANAEGKILIQEFIKGFSASMSILATANAAKVLTINEQLLGLPFLFQREPFGYCGNILPLPVTDSTFKKCEHIAKKIASHFGLKGSNGVDLVISKEGKPYVIEVNPRFQGTQECVERVLGINLVESHIKACLDGSLPNISRKKPFFCTRLILYSPKRVKVPNLTRYQEVRDIPLPESIIEKGEPLCSILTMGKSRDSSIQKAEKLVGLIYSMLSPA